MSIDRPVVAQPEFFEDDARHKQSLDAFFHFMRELGHRFSGDRLHKTARLIMEVRVSRVRHDAV